MLNHTELMEILESDKPFTILAKILTEDAVSISEFMQAIPNDKAVFVFRLLPKDLSAEIFAELPPAEQMAVIEALTDTETGAVIDRLRPDASMDFLEELPAGLTKKLLRNAKPEKRARLNQLLKYPVGSAGSIMRIGFVDLKASSTVNDALEKIRNEGSDASTLYTCYVTGPTRHLEGVVTAEKLMLAPLDHIIGEIMDTDFVYAGTTDDQESAARLFIKHGLITLPIVDSEKRLVGIITVDDAMVVIEAEATEDIYNQAGIADITGSELDCGDVLVNGSMWQIGKVRLPFLLATLVFGLAAGAVIDGFEDILAGIPAVAIFIPIIMGMGGNVGAQSSTLFVRGVALGQINANSMKHFMKPFMKEIGVGFSIGAVIGICTGVIAAIWKGIQGMQQAMLLGAAVGVALVITMTSAALLGFLVPYVLKKFNADQAAGAGPIITSLKDIIALVIYFVCINIFLN